MALDSNLPGSFPQTQPGNLATNVPDSEITISDSITVRCHLWLDLEAQGGKDALNSCQDSKGGAKTVSVHWSATVKLLKKVKSVLPSAVSKIRVK